MLVDVFSKGLTGKVAEAALGKAGITVNKNAIPFDQNPPMVASGIRIGTPAVTTRGMAETEMDAVGGLILRALGAHDNDSALAAIKGEVEALCARFPLYQGLVSPTTRHAPLRARPGRRPPAASSRAAVCRRLRARDRPRPCGLEPIPAAPRPG